MQRLKVVAAPEAVKGLRQLAQENYMSIYVDGKYLKLKHGRSEAVLEQAPKVLEAGSFEIYRSTYSGSFHRPAYTASRPDAIRIRIK